MDQGAVSIFKAFLLRTMLKGNVEAVQVSNNDMLREYWKSYGIMKGLQHYSGME
jgi:hypothetical protein